MIGGDTTAGPLSMTLAIHGYVPAGRALKRSGAKPGDWITSPVRRATAQRGTSDPPGSLNRE
ncbi:hypothetical protein KIF59_23915 [Enterobacter cloacae subsp. cloacae]|nr:hypothetical protein [Enterobacter cloacae subsp. cloacae]